MCPLSFSASPPQSSSPRVYKASVCLRICLAPPAFVLPVCLSFPTLSSLTSYLFLLCLIRTCLHFFALSLNVNLRFFLFLFFLTYLSYGICAIWNLIFCFSLLSCFLFLQIQLILYMFSLCTITISLLDASNMISICVASNMYYLHIHHRVAVRWPSATQGRGGSGPTWKMTLCSPLSGQMHMWALRVNNVMPVMDWPNVETR